MNIPRCCAFVALLWILDVSIAGAQCTFSVSPTGFTVDSTASSRTISIVTGTQCSWTAISAASWITIASGASGSGIGAVTFLIEQNSTATSRTGTLVVAGQTVSITQGTGNCASSVTPTSFAVDSAATSRTVSITSGTQCSWTATSTAAWITVTSGATGSGVGSVTFSIGANAGGTRTGALTIAGRSVTVNQAAGVTTVPAPPVNLRFVTGGANP
jgi:hypothetical protein